MGVGKPTVQFLDTVSDQKLDSGKRPGNETSLRYVRGHEVCVTILCSRAPPKRYL